jgi:hypothetical protein
VPDMYGRPWARLWEKNFEKGMQRPDDQGRALEKLLFD